MHKTTAQRKTAHLAQWNRSERSRTNQWEIKERCFLCQSLLFSSAPITHVWKLKERTKGSAERSARTGTRFLAWIQGSDWLGEPRPWSQVFPHSGADLEPDPGFCSFQECLGCGFMSWLGGGAWTPLMAGTGGQAQHKFDPTSLSKTHKIPDPKITTSLSDTGLGITSTSGER